MILTIVLKLMMIEWIDTITNFIQLKKTNAQLSNHLRRHYEHLQNHLSRNCLLCQRSKANSEDEANEKLFAMSMVLKMLKKWSRRVGDS